MFETFYIRESTLMQEDVDDESVLCLPVTGLSRRRTDDGLRISAKNL